MANLHAVTVTSAQPVVTTAETIIATMSPFSVANPAGQGVELHAAVNMTSGTGTTALVFTVRRGTTLAGTVVPNAYTHNTTAGNVVTVSLDVLDPVTSASNQQYVLTVTQTGASANGSVALVAFTAMAATATE